MSGSMSDTMGARMASAELDRRWLRGDPGAFEEVYERYRSRLEAVAYRIVGNRSDAEDVVQNLFLGSPGRPTAARRASGATSTEPR